MEGKNGVEFYNNCLQFDSEDPAVFDEWFDKVQEWGFRHSWFSARAGSFLADVYFRKADNQIEISWDNRELFKDIEYDTPEGTCYVDTEEFSAVIYDFIQTYRKLIKGERNV